MTEKKLTKTQLSYEAYILMKINMALDHTEPYGFEDLAGDISELEYLIPSHEDADFKSAKKHLSEIFGKMEYKRTMATELKNAEGITRLLQQKMSEF